MSDADLEVMQGASFAADVTWRDDEGNPIDLTGYTVSAAFRSRGASLSGVSFVVTDAAAGEMRLEVTAQATSANPGRWSYALRASSGSQVTVLAKGDFRIRSVAQVVSS
jgi:hypothetical protein